MATLEQKNYGMSVQHNACNTLNAYFAANKYALHATETDELTDKTKGYDIFITTDDKKEVLRVDIKSTLTYTYKDKNGKLSSTSSAELNVDNIALVFALDSDAAKLYFIDMNEWYKLWPTLPSYHGKTYIMQKIDGTVVGMMDKKNGRLVDLKHFHKVQLETKEECGETYKVYTAYDYVSGKRIELQYDSSKQQWYFENASEYVRIPLDLLVKISQKPYHGSIINI